MPRATWHLGSDVPGSAEFSRCIGNHCRRSLHNWCPEVRAVHRERGSSMVHGNGQKRAGHCRSFMIHTNNSNTTPRCSASRTTWSFCAPIAVEDHSGDDQPLRRLRYARKRQWLKDRLRSPHERGERCVATRLFVGEAYDRTIHQIPRRLHRPPRRAHQ